jgi:hypothetical protein
MQSQWNKRESALAAVLSAVLIGACEDPVRPEPDAAASAVTPAAAALPGLALRWASSGHSSENKSAEVGCGEGQSVLGIGGRIRGGDGQVVMDALIPEATLGPGGDATVRASEIGNGTTELWSIVAYAICAEVPTIERGRIGEISSTSPRETEIGISDNPCSLQNQVLTGTGGEIVDGPPGRILLEALIPSQDLQGVTVRAAEQPDTAATWRLDARSICADLPNVQRVVRTSLNTSENKHVTAQCPGDARVVGTGGEIIGGGGHVVMTYIVPDADLTRVHVRGAEGEEGTDANWAVRAYAICATA